MLFSLHVVSELYPIHCWCCVVFHHIDLACYIQAARTSHLGFSRSLFKQGSGASWSVSPGDPRRVPKVYMCYLG